MENTEEQLIPATTGVSSSARIIPDGEHPITREMLDGDALAVMRKLNRAGFSSYLVGGGVRDLYLGKTPKDFDISTDARPGQIRKLFPNSNTIGRRFRLVQVFFRNGKVIEISTLRSLSEHDLDGPQAVLAPNNTYGSLDEDAQRRDLTINSLFYEIEQHTIIDYVGGVKDLDNSVIRIVGDPEKRINRDPVRMIRALRHAARAGFTIDGSSWRAICANHHKLLLCPPSRLRDEILKDLYSGDAAAWFELTVDADVFTDLFPVYAETLYSPLASGFTGRELLSRIFAMIDRINTLAVSNDVSRQPAGFLLGLILIPWAEARYQLLETSLKGSALYQIGKNIRSDLDHELSNQLNLRRSLRQEITTLIVNLSLMLQHRHNNSWPKWLRKKSYFQRCSLFYHCYMEAVEGKIVQDKQLNVAHNTHNTPKQNRKKRSTHSRKRPAFGPRSQGGVFGFKK